MLSYLLRRNPRAMMAFAGVLSVCLMMGGGELYQSCTSRSRVWASLMLIRIECAYRCRRRLPIWHNWNAGCKRGCIIFFGIDGRGYGSVPGAGMPPSTCWASKSQAGPCIKAVPRSPSGFKPDWVALPRVYILIIHKGWGLSMKA